MGTKGARTMASSRLMGKSAERASGVGEQPVDPSPRGKIPHHGSSRQRTGARCRVDSGKPQPPDPQPEAGSR